MASLFAAAELPALKPAAVTTTTITTANTAQPTDVVEYARYVTSWMNTGGDAVGILNSQLVTDDEEEEVPLSVTAANAAAAAASASTSPRARCARGQAHHHRSGGGGGAAEGGAVAGPSTLLLAEPLTALLHRRARRSDTVQSDEATRSLSGSPSPSSPTAQRAATTATAGGDDDSNDDAAAAAWDETGLQEAVQWLSRGVSHLTGKERPLRGTAFAQAALNRVLAAAPTTGAEGGDQLLCIVQCTEYRASLLILLFHADVCVRYWARETLLQLISHTARGVVVGGTSSTRHSGASGASAGNNNGNSGGSATPLQALWALAVQLLCTLKHLRHTQLLASASSRVVDKAQHDAVADGFYGLWVVLTALDQRLTAVAASEPGPSLVHPVTALLLGGCMVLYWFFQQAHGDSHDGGDTHGRGLAATAATPAAAPFGRRASLLRALVETINGRLRHDPTLRPLTLAVEVRKSVVKVLVHGLLDNAKGGPPLTREEAAWRLGRMRALWQYAAWADPPSPKVTSALATTTTPMVVAPARSAGWMAKAVLRNAEVQLNVEGAVNEAKQRPRPPLTSAAAATGGSLPSAVAAPSASRSPARSGAPGHAAAVNDADTASGSTPALRVAVYALYALLSTAQEVVPELVASTFFHDVLLLHEQQLVTLAIGGVLHLHSEPAVRLLHTLFWADLQAFSGGGRGGASSGGLRAGAVVGVPSPGPHSSDRPTQCLQRLWTNYPILLRQVAKAGTGVPASSLLQLLELLHVLLEVPEACAGWLWTSEHLADEGPAPLARQVGTFLTQVRESLETNAVPLRQLWESGAVGVTETATATAATAASRLLTSGSLLPRVAHAMQFAQDHLLSRLADAVGAVFLHAISPPVQQSFHADAGMWLWQHVVLAEPELQPHSSLDLFLQLHEARVDNAARAHGRAWLRVLAGCTWGSGATPPKALAAAWWVSALEADVVRLEPAERRTLLDDVVTQLPPPPSSVEETHHSTHGSPCPALSDEDADSDDHGKPGEAPTTPAMVTASAANGGVGGPLRSRHRGRLYGVMRQLFLSLLEKHAQYPPDSLVAALVRVAGMLPTARVVADRALLESTKRHLVRLCQLPLPQDSEEVLRQYAPAWLREAARLAHRSVDDLLAEQNRRFEQFEWEEKQAVAEGELARAKATEEAERRRVNVAQRRRELEERQQQQQRDRAALVADVVAGAGRTSGGMEGQDTEAELVVVLESRPPAKRGRGEEGRDGGDGGGVGSSGSDSDSGSLSHPPVALMVAQQWTSSSARQRATTTTTVAAAAAAPCSQSPSVLQQRLQAMQMRQQAQSNHAESEDYLQRAMRRIAASTEVVHHPTPTDDIVGTGRHCLAAEVPVLPEVFVRNPSSTPSAGAAGAHTTGCSGESDSGLVPSLIMAGTTYARCFAPHIALELRCDTSSKFDDLMEVCRSSYNSHGSGKDNDHRHGMRGNRLSHRHHHHHHHHHHHSRSPPPSRGGVGSDERLSLAMWVTRLAPVNAVVVQQSLSVVHVARGATDPLDPNCVSFTVSAAAVPAGGGASWPPSSSSFSTSSTGTATALQHSTVLSSQLSEGDVVVVLLPLAAFVPTWATQTGAVPPTAGNSTAARREGRGGGGVAEADAEAVLRRLPEAWRVLGCFPQVCYVAHLPPGQRLATLHTYPAHTPHPPPLPFVHALQMGFGASAAPATTVMYIRRLNSVQPACMSITALHAISHTQFASTLYDPGSSATESATYHDAVTAYLGKRGVLPQVRRSLLLQSSLNDWQVRAVAAVLYAVRPQWDRRPVPPLFSTLPRTDDRHALFGSSPPPPLVGAAVAATEPSPFVESDFTTTRVAATQFLLVEGPPGTGKTQTIATLVLNLLQHLPSAARVLLCAPSNCAVDEALLRVHRLRRRLRSHSSNLAAGATSRVYTGELLRVGVRENVDSDVLGLQPPVFLDDLVDRIVQNGDGGSSSAPAGQRGGGGGGDADRAGPRGEQRQQQQQRRAVESAGRRAVAKEQVVWGSSVVFSTLGSLNQLQRVNPPIRFDVVIVDEASQGTEPDVLQALMLAKSRCVLVGDSKQLQPTVLCPEAARRGLRRSLLVRLLHNGHHSFLLRTQYRMHPDICAFPNVYFYTSQLRTDSGVLQRPTLPGVTTAKEREGDGGSGGELSIAQRFGTLPRMAFVDVADGAMARGRGRSLRNHAEAVALVQCMRQVRVYLRLSVDEFASHAGIITYYRAQKDTIVSQLTREERMSGMQIATVDSFQGKEKDIIFVSCVRTRPPPPPPRQRPRSGAEQRRDGDDDGDDRADRSTSDREEEGEGGDADTEDSGGVASPTSSEAAASSSSSLYNTSSPAGSLGFLADWHRINVSLTRARELCVVCGQREAFARAAMAVDRSTWQSSPDDRHRAGDNDPLVLYSLAEYVGQRSRIGGYEHHYHQSGRRPVSGESFAALSAGGASSPLPPPAGNAAAAAPQQQQQRPDDDEDSVVIVDVEEERQVEAVRQQLAAAEAVYVRYSPHLRLLQEMERAASLAMKRGE